MKHIAILLFCIVCIQGCARNYADSMSGKNRDGFETGPNLRAEYGSSCNYTSNDDIGSCAAAQDLVGTHCVCHSKDGLQNGSIR